MTIHTSTIRWGDQYGNCETKISGATVIIGTMPMIYLEINVQVIFIGTLIYLCRGLYKQNIRRISYILPQKAFFGLNSHKFN